MEVTQMGTLGSVSPSQSPPHTPKYTNTQWHASPVASIGRQLVCVQLWRSHMAASFTEASVLNLTFWGYTADNCSHFRSFEAEVQQGFRHLNATGNWKKHSWLQTICRIVRETVLFCLILGLRSPFNQHFKWASSFLQRDYLHWPSTGKIPNF